MKSVLFLILFINTNIFGNEYSFSFPDTESRNDSCVTIFLINYGWHTGFVISLNESTIKLIPSLSLFKEYDYVDIGWGDEDFYQHPDFDLYLAAKAILTPTTSVLRIEGYHLAIEHIIDFSEFVIKFNLTQESFFKLADYINRSFKFDAENEFQVTSKQKNGKIIFFKSRHKYHLFNTCNTWAANALKSAGINIEPFGIITDIQLFKEAGERGKIIKALK